MGHFTLLVIASEMTITLSRGDLYLLLMPYFKINSEKIDVFIESLERIVKVAGTY